MWVGERDGTSDKTNVNFQIYFRTVKEIKWTWTWTLNILDSVSENHTQKHNKYLKSLIKLLRQYINKKKCKIQLLIINLYKCVTWHKLGTIIGRIIQDDKNLQKEASQCAFSNLISVSISKPISPSAARWICQLGLFTSPPGSIWTWFSFKRLFFTITSDKR